jgi:ketosteroid isomerase-like protein
MKKIKFHPSTLILSSAVIVLFTFAGRSIGPIPGGAGDRTNNSGDTLSDELQRVAMQVKEAFIRGDSSLYLKTFTPDACILAPNMPSLCGQRGLVQFYKNTRKAGIGDTEFHSLGLYGQTAEYVTEQGTFEVSDAAGHSINKGKLLNIWKKTDQGWKIFRQMLNFDAPMPTPPASSK